MLKYRILIVEDDISLVQMLRVALSGEYEVVSAPDGYTGLQQAQVVEPDLIILDILMPQMDGYEFCEAARSIPQLQNISIIVITGQAVNDVEKRLKNATITAILQKPFTIERLLEQVHKLLYHVPPSPKKVAINEIQQ